ncbi:hypothetical protein [Kitasatospora sp. NPDC005748]|uniref:hypothetical protein n=1 Tax=Kitasatospora sp. NPDC005748 TaxID=3157063 RepID=UPI0033F163D2
MTDKLPRRTGGDGDGPDDTPMERLLREAMNARAMQITAHDLRPAAPPTRRLRRLKPVYLAAVPLFGLAAAMAFGVLGFRGDTVADRGGPGPAATVTASASPSPSAVPTVEPTPADTPTAAGTETSAPAADPTGTGEPAVPGGAATPRSTQSSTAPPTTAATPYTFRGVKFKVPAGWRVVPPDPAGTSLCVLSPGAPTGAQPGWTQEACEPYGVLITAYNTADEAEHAIWPTAFDLDSSSGFSHQPSCPVWGHPYVPTGPYTKIGEPAKSRDIVAGRAISKTQWQVTCKPGEDFTAQMWGLKDDQVFITANGLKPDYQPGLVSILDTIDLSGRQAPSVAGQNDISVTVEGLTTGQQLPNDGTPVEFVVTFKNTGRTSYAQVVPQLVAESYAGSKGAVTGTLERANGAGSWKALTIAPPAAGKPVFDDAGPLAPGNAFTIRYRMKLTAQDGAGVMPVTVSALVAPEQGPPTVIGTRTVPVRVVAK